MDAIILWLTGGDRTRNIKLISLNGGVDSPGSSRGLWPNPAATRGGSLQAMITQRDGPQARRAERENGPAAPSGVRSGTRRNNMKTLRSIGLALAAVLLLAGVLSAQAPTGGRARRR